jgi:hypothetical protein
LAQTMSLMRVAGRHEERRVHFQTPRTTLDWTGGGEFGKVARDGDSQGNLDTTFLGDEKKKGDGGENRK